MSNPFLFDDDGGDDVGAEVAANPFLQDPGTDAAAESEPAENPFFTQPRKQSTASINPFADYADDIAVVTEFVEPVPPVDPVAVQPSVVDSAMSFFGTTIKDEEEEHHTIFNAGKADDTKGPPSRPTPPSQDTKDLISTVADHLDQTSTHMLDRIPVTRTPSPVSMRDLHSPSPTPECADLLEVDDAPIETVNNDNPFADITDVAEVAPPKPTRPSPPRRPSPPSQTIPAQQIETDKVSQNDVDLFDMFGTGATQKPQANVPKTNQDIINLYSAPKQTVVESKPDLLTSDIFSNDQSRIAPEVVPSKPSRPPPPPPSRPPAPGRKQPETSIAEVKHDIEREVPIQNIQIVDEPAISITPVDDRMETLSDQSSAVSSNIGISENPSPYHSAATNNSQSPESRDEITNSYINQTDSAVDVNPFGAPPIIHPVHATKPMSYFQNDNDEFDAFAAKFESVKRDESLLDGFHGSSGYKSPLPIADAWGNSDIVNTADSAGFEADDGFLSMQAPPQPERKLIPAPPPSRGSQNSFYDDNRSDEAMSARSLPISENQKPQRTDSQESPSTPLFDDDVSQPLEDFPRINYRGEGWEMQLRQPTKKKITGQRFWKKVFLRIVLQNDTPVVQLLNSAKDKDPFQELPLQACYSVSEISAQPYDQFGKIFTLKLQYIFYKERPGVRPGQVTKAERLTNKLTQFAAYAIQGDYQGVKEFGSDLKKLGLPVEHAPQVSQLFKLGSHNYEDLKQFSVCIEEHLFKFNVHRDRALTYKMEEVQVTGVDEIWVEQNSEGQVMKQIARVRLFFLAFLTGMPTIELGVNDMWRQGKEVVGRHDIIPVATEEWIRLEGVEFHSCVQQEEYERSRLIRFLPPDACYIELMRYRVRPPKNRELPLQLKATWVVTGKKVELRADILVPGFASRKLGQIPCEDVAIRFPIPECWIYLFRVEKHFRYGSVKSAHRRTGKIKGIERILGTVDQLQESLIEVTSGQAKYEHHHRAIVWRCPRLPKEGQGAYTTHQMVVRMALTSYDQIPAKLAEHCFVEFTMPATTVSHTTIRSVSVQDSDSDDPPEKYVRYLARHEYTVGIEYTQGESQNAYLAATTVKREAPAAIKEEPTPAPPPVDSDSDSDST